MTKLCPQNAHQSDYSSDMRAHVVEMLTNMSDSAAMGCAAPRPAQLETCGPAPQRPARPSSRSVAPRRSAPPGPARDVWPHVAAPRPAQLEKCGPTSQRTPPPSLRKVWPHVAAHPAAQLEKSVALRGSPPRPVSPASASSKNALAYAQASRRRFETDARDSLHSCAGVPAVAVERFPAALTALSTGNDDRASVAFGAVRTFPTHSVVCAAVLCTWSIGREVWRAGGAGRRGVRGRGRRGGLRARRLGRRRGRGVRHASPS